MKISTGDYIIRADQPYRTLVDLYFSLQNYPVANPLPYDDTGWTMPLMRNVTVKKVTDKTLFDQPMTMVAKDVVVPGVIQGTGDVLVVENTTDNVLATFRFKNVDTKMEAAEEDFDLDGHHLRAGAFVIRNGNDAKVRAVHSGARTHRVCNLRDDGKDPSIDCSAYRLCAFMAENAG